MLKRWAIMLAAIYVIASAPMLATNSHEPPPAKGQTVGANKGNQNTGDPKDNAPHAPLVVEAHVTGELKTTAKNAGQETQDENSPWLDPISIFTGLLVLVGGGQVWFLYQTNKGTQKTAEAAKQSADAVVGQLRAYVFIDAYEIRNFGTDKPLEGWMMLKNSGSTPAHDLERSAKLFYSPYPAVEFPEIDWPGGKGYLAPGGEVFFGPIPLPRALTPEENERIIAGTHAVYLFGKIRYTDVFKHQRNITFRSLYRAPMDRIGVGGSTLTTQQDTEGNSSD
jgi:hypothetical protein